MIKYKIPKGENYHLEKIGEILKIQYSVKGKVYSRNVLPELSTPEKLALCDEMLSLFSGNLVRIRDEISII